MKQLGGFQEAASVLSALSGRTYSRQGVQQMWKRREFNGFPDRGSWSINGKVRELFDLDEVEAWYHMHRRPGGKRERKQGKLVYATVYPATPEEQAREDAKLKRTEIVEWITDEEDLDARSQQGAPDQGGDCQIRAA